MPNPIIIVRKSDRGRFNHVLVSLRFGRKTGVEILRHKLAIHEADRGRQAGVDGLQPVFWRHATPNWSIKVRHLAISMHSRIGSTRTMNFDWSFSNRGKALLQFLLNRNNIGLELPTLIRSAVVCDCDFMPHPVG